MPSVASTDLSLPFALLWDRYPPPPGQCTRGSPLPPPSSPLSPLPSLAPSNFTPHPPPPTPNPFPQAPILASRVSPSGQLSLPAREGGTITPMYRVPRLALLSDGLSPKPSPLHPLSLNSNHRVGYYEQCCLCSLLLLLLEIGSMGRRAGRHWVGYTIYKVHVSSVCMMMK